MAFELYDYLTAANGYTDPEIPDYATETLTIKAQGVVSEEGAKNQRIHTGDDKSEERITLGVGSRFSVSWDWRTLTETDAGTILDLYHNSAKANGCENTFKWLSYDGHTYVVRFDINGLTRTRHGYNWWGYSRVKLIIRGRITDA